MIPMSRDAKMWLVLLSLVLLGVLMAGKFRDTAELEVKLAGIDRPLSEIQEQLSDGKGQYAPIKNEMRRTRQEFCEALNTGQCGERP